jgi:hypothetical protein
LAAIIARSRDVKLPVPLIASMLLVFASVPAAHADRLEAIDAAIEPLKDGRRVSLDDVQKAILAACKARNFACMVMSPGLISARYVHNPYYLAEVSIPFSEQSYQIRYKHSVGMGYNAEKNKIKGDYTAWVEALCEHIEAHLDRARKQLKKQKAGA